MVHALEDVADALSRLIHPDTVGVIDVAAAVGITVDKIAAEDEKDVSKVTMRMFMFEALVQGYLSSAKSFLTPLEKSLLPFSGKLLTMECGIRFLTDYLSGDVYFKIHRPEHNLDRCRTQMALVESIEAQMDEMKAIVDRY